MPTLVLLTIGWASVGRDSIVADFRTGSFDPQLFRLEAGRSRGQWDAREGELRGTLPRGRPGLRFIGRFSLEGDFNVSVRFRVEELPKPTTQVPDLLDHDVSNNLALILPESNRFATVYRNHRGTGPGIGFFAPASDNRLAAAGHGWAREDRGRLSLRRHGSMLTFLAAEGDDPLVELGSVEYGTDPVPEVALEVMALNTSDALDVRFQEFRVEAERIIEHKVTKGRLSPALVCAALVHFVVLAGAIAALRWAGPRRGPAA